MDGKKIINLLSVFIVLGVGGAGGYLFALSRPATPKSAQAVPVNTNELAKANRRIAELEKALAAAERRTTAKPVPAAGRGAPKADGLPKGKSIALDASGDVFDQLKKQLPKEAFGQVTNTLERMRTAQQKRTKGKLEFLSSLDTSWMSAKELETHRKLLKLLTRREEIMAKTKGIILPTDMQTIQETAMLGMEMGPLAKDERAALIRQTARTLGFKGEEVDTIHDTINDIFNATGSMGPLGGISEMIDDIGGGGGAVMAVPKVEVKSSVNVDADDFDD